MKDTIKKILRESKIQKAIEIQAPNTFDKKDGYKTVFLAGSIEGNDAEEWQKKVIKSLADEPIMFLNPRRDNYDKSLKQDITNKQFKEQVEWELNSLEKADVIVMYFDKDTKSAISLLELGLHATSGKMILCCPEGFWRKGNVDIMCMKYDINQVDTIEEIINFLKTNE